MAADRPRRILVIDSNLAVLEIVRSILVRKGYEVTTVTSCLMAFEALQEQVIDLIISDVLVPDMDGTTFVKRLKADPTLSAMPVIFLTALDGLEDELEGYLVGAGAYLSKPFKARDLVASVRRLLDQEVTNSTLRQAWSRCLMLGGDASLATALTEQLQLVGVRLLHLPSSPKSLTELDHERYHLLVATLTEDGLPQCDILRFLDSFELKLPLILLHAAPVVVTEVAMRRAEAVMPLDTPLSVLTEQCRAALFVR